MVSIHPTISAHHRKWKKPAAMHTAEGWRVGSATHANNNNNNNNNKVLMTRGSTSSMDRIPMLTIGLLRRKPTFASCALWALHKLNENLAKALIPGSTCHRLPPPNLRKVFPHMIGGLFSPHELRVSRCRHTTHDRRVRPLCGAPCR